MKNLIQLLSVIILIPLLMGAGTKHGGHVGNGGDIRRFRADQAKKLFVREVARFHQSVQKSDCQDQFKAIDPQLIKKSNEMVQWSVRMVNTWVDDDLQKNCMNFEKRNSDIKLSFSFDQCLASTPRNYYSNLITSSFLGAFITPGATSNLMTLDQFRELNDSCLGAELRDVSSDMMYSPSSFKDNESALGVFEKGRKAALMVLSQLDANTIQSDESFSPPIRHFLSLSLKQLTIEVAQSKYEMGNDARTCGLTQLTSKSPIYFSLENCVNLQSDRDVAWIIIHESTHHLGVDAENFADRVATEILNIR